MHFHLEPDIFKVKWESLALHAIIKKGRTYSNKPTTPLDSNDYVNQQ
jgi:hypothetical protein